MKKIGNTTLEESISILKNSIRFFPFVLCSFVSILYILSTVYSGLTDEDCKKFCIRSVAFMKMTTITRISKENITYRVGQKSFDFFVKLLVGS